MTVYLVPGVFGAGGQILDSNGKVASGALVNTYAAGTTSTVPVFTTNAGNVTAAKPVVCNADGRLPYELWQTQGQAIKILLTDSSSNTLGTYDNLYGDGDPSATNAVTGYFKLTSIGGTANAITATGPSNLVSLSAGQVFQIVPVSSNTGATTLTITPSGGTSLGAVNVFTFGAASQGNDLIANVPVLLEYDGTRLNILGYNTLTISKPVLFTYVSGAAITLSGTSINEYKASSITAAGTVDLGAVQGNFVDMVGGTTVTSFGTVQAGTVRTVRMSAAPVLNYSVTSLILPGAQSITTATGDVVQMVSLGGGNWQARSYQRADGTQLGSPTAAQGASLVLATAAKTASGSASITFTSSDFNWTVSDEVEITGVGVTLATNSQYLLFTISTDGGSTYSNTAAQYCYDLVISASNSAAASVDINEGATPRIDITDSATGISNNAPNGVNFKITIFQPNNSNNYKGIHIKSSWPNSGASGRTFCANGSATFVSTTAMNGIKIAASSGNISGTFYARYLKAS